MKRMIILAFSIFLVLSAAAQDTLPVPANIQSAYDKQTRSRKGGPGIQYWQNRADYDLAVSFDPASRLLNGTAVIVYKNSSPDTLRELWFKLYPNLYQKREQRQKTLKRQIRMKA